MKKIIATVLAMVMALALCTTAFAAAQTYDFYDAKTGSEVGLPADETLTYTKAATKAPKAVAYYTCDTTTGDLKDAKLIECDAADADYIVKYHDSSKVAMYVKVGNPVYIGDGKAFTAIGKACGQFKLDETKYDADTKFYTATDKDDNVILFVESDVDTTNLMVDGKLVAVEELGKLSEKVVQHTWVLDRTAMTAKCSACGATAKLYKSVAECGTADYEQVAVGLYAVVTNTADTTKPAGTSSPKTFDAGIAMYVGMALTSVAGSAVVIGKKKEF